MRRFIATFLLAAIVGCSQSETPQESIYPEEQAFARRCVDLLKQQRSDELEQAADPGLKGKTIRDTLPKMIALIPKEEPTSVKLIGHQEIGTPNAFIVQFFFESAFSGRWLLTSVAVKREKDKLSMAGISVLPGSASFEEQFRQMSLAKGSAIRYLVLGLAMVLPIFTLVALITCVRTKLAAGKWFWILFIIVGFGKFAVNWTTGLWTFSLLSIQLFSASAFKPIFPVVGQWVIAVSLPLGAITFLLCRKFLRAPVACPQDKRVEGAGITTFRQLNDGWNADSNNPNPVVAVECKDVVVSFLRSTFEGAQGTARDRARLRFVSVWRYRLGPTNDDGWFNGQCRFSKLAPRWGAFYEVRGDLRLEECPDAWIEVGPAPANSRHFLFYFRDATFECDASDWKLEP